MNPACVKCDHLSHVGWCCAPIIVQSIETSCECFNHSGIGIDKRSLRQKDAAQQRAAGELSGNTRRSQRQIQ